MDIKLYPNGNKDTNKGSVQIFLKLVSLPPSLQKLCTSLTIFSQQTYTSFTHLTNYTKSDQSKGLPSNMLLLKEWKFMNLTKISFTTSIKINYIELNKNSDYLSLFHLTPYIHLNKLKMKYQNEAEYSQEMDNKLVVMMKNSYTGQSFESNLFDNMWKLYIYPNGMKHEQNGKFSIFLKLCILPPFIQTMTIKYLIKCKETNSCFSSNVVFSFDKNIDGTNNFMQFQRIQLLQKLTFILQVEIKKIDFVDPQNIYNVHDPLQIQRILSFVNDNGNKNVIQPPATGQIPLS